MPTLTIRRGNAGQTHPISAGTSVADAFGAVGIWLDLPCGGRGSCGGCRIEVRGELSSPTSHEVDVLSADALEVGWRLACQALIMGDVQVDLTETSADSHGNAPFIHDVLNRRLGMALDLGSTTMAGRIVDRDNGEVLMEKVLNNPQVSVGSDLITRVQTALEPDGASRMKDLALRGIHTLLAFMADSLGIRPEKIEAMTVAGNSVMQHLLLGWSVESLSMYPFVPTSLDSVTVESGQLGIDLSPKAEVYIFPLIGSFVGGDATAGVYALDLPSKKGAYLLADLGTNGEVLLSVDGEILAASTAAGPAFEGGEITWGTRAERGAVVDLDIRSGWRLTTIGEAKPRGIAGSGLIRIIAELLNCGLLSPEGRLRRPEELSGEPARWAVDRIRSGKNGFEVVLDPERAIVLTQRDIRQLQLAKGAIRSAIDALLAEAGLIPARLDGIYLAGAFGSVLDPESLFRIGLLPHISVDRVKAAGNTSLEGAAQLLHHPEDKAKIEAVARGIRHVALEARPEFQDAFVRAMSFPGSNPQP